MAAGPLRRGAWVRPWPCSCRIGPRGGRRRVRGGLRVAAPNGLLPAGDRGIGNPRPFRLRAMATAHFALTRSIRRPYPPHPGLCANFLQGISALYGAGLTTMERSGELREPGCGAGLRSAHPSSLVPGPGPVDRVIYAHCRRRATAGDGALHGEPHQVLAEGQRIPVVGADDLA